MFCHSCEWLGFIFLGNPVCLNTVFGPQCVGLARLPQLLSSYPVRVGLQWVHDDSLLLTATVSGVGFWLPVDSVDAVR